MKRHRLAIVVSHPIQYQAPWFRALAQTTDLTVFFCHQQQAADHARGDFGIRFEWDVPLLDGYDHHWLENRSRQPDVSSFAGCDTPDIADLLATGHFDACIVSGWYLKSYVQAIRACQRLDIPVLLRGDSQLATSRSTLVSLAKYFPYRWLLQHVDGHLYVGQANRDYLRHYGVADSKLFFVPHCVDNAFFCGKAEAARRSGTAAELRAAIGANRTAGHGDPRVRHDLDSSLGYDLDSPVGHGLQAVPTSTVFAFVGKLVEKKRPADFVRALHRARSLEPDCRGLIVGTGPLEQELRGLVDELAVPVTFAGFKNQSELPCYFAASDALVLPSDGGETWGLVVNEAMACGLPALVSRAAGCTRDLIDEQRTGYAFDLGSIEQLSEAMVIVARRLRSDAQAFRSAVLNKIEQYSIQAACNSTVNALDAVVLQHRATGTPVGSGVSQQP